MEKESEDKFADLRKALEDTTEWPVVYMFKFIFPANVKKYTLVTALFGSDAEVYTKNSKTGKFTSVTAKEVMLSADDVMHVYQRASQIEGVMIL